MYKEKIIGAFLDTDLRRLCRPTSRPCWGTTEFPLIQTRTLNALGRVGIRTPRELFAAFKKDRRFYEGVLNIGGVGGKEIRRFVYRVGGDVE